MSSIIEGNKRDPTFDLTKRDVVDNYLWSRHITEHIAGTNIVTKEWSKFGIKKFFGMLGYVCQKLLHFESGRRWICSNR